MMIINIGLWNIIYSFDVNSKDHIKYTKYNKIYNYLRIKFMNRWIEVLYASMQPMNMLRYIV